MVMNPNATYLEVFVYFLEPYAKSNKIECQNNRNKMITDWHLNDNFDALITRIHGGVLYANFANQPLKDHDIVDIATQVAMKSGIVADKYKEWHKLDAGDFTCIDWQRF